MQLNIYVERLKLVAANFRIPISRLPDVMSAWTVQGRQWDFVILDQVISSREQIADFGITQTEELQNVMHSRARLALWEIVPSAILTGFFGQTNEKTNNRRKQWTDEIREQVPGLKKFNPTLYVVDHVTMRRHHRQS